MAGKSNKTAESFCYFCPCRPMEKESPFLAGPQAHCLIKNFPLKSPKSTTVGVFDIYPLAFPRICLSLVLGIHHPSQILLAVAYPQARQLTRRIPTTNEHHAGRRHTEPSSCNNAPGSLGIISARPRLSLTCSIANSVMIPPGISPFSPSPHFLWRRERSQLLGL